MKKRHLAIKFSLCMILFSGNTTHALPKGEWIDYPESGIELGQGWDSRAGAQKPARCVVYSPVYVKGQSSSVALKEVNDVSELRENLSISAKASVSGLFGSASASAKYLSNTQINQSQKHYSLRAVVQNGPIFTGPYSPAGAIRYGIPEGTATPVPPNGLDKHINRIRLTDEALALYKKGDRKKFKEMCGDHFVYTMQSGAELLATISHKQIDKKTDKEVEASIKASFSFGSGSGSTESATRASLQKSELEISVLQIGGGLGILAVSQDKLREKLESLQTEASKTPTFYDIYITPYENLFIEDDSVDFERPPNAEGVLIDQYLEIRTLYANILAYLSSPDSYYGLFHDPVMLSENYRACLLEFEEIITSKDFTDSATAAEKLIESFDSARSRCPLISKIPADEGKSTGLVENVKHFIPQMIILQERAKGPIFRDRYSNRNDFLRREIFIPTRRACEQRASHIDCVSEPELAGLLSIFVLKSKTRNGCLHHTGSNALMYLGKCDDSALHFKIDEEGNMIVQNTGKEGHCGSFINNTLRVESLTNKCQGKFSITPEEGLRVTWGSVDRQDCAVDNSRARNNLVNLKCGDLEVIRSGL